MKEICKNCRYWHKIELPLLKHGISDSKGHTLGECRRHPPTVYPLDKERKKLDRLNRFPVVEQDCWCGDFELKDWQKLEETQNVNEIDNEDVNLKQLEKWAITHALNITKGNREQAARLLGIGERTLYRKIKEYE